jgi:sugar transferase (PEP-CTERM/EpsH1 system associated)
VKILYLAHRLPYPPNKGEKIRIFHQIQQLAKRHTIHLCSFVDDPDDLAYVSALRTCCASVEVVYRGRSVGAYFRAAVGFLRGLPLSVSLFYRRALATKVLQKVAAERFDCVIVSSSSMAQYAVNLCPNVKILDFIDIDSEKWRLYAQRHSFPVSFIYQLEAERLATYEKEMAQVFEHCFLISEEEGRLLRRRVSGQPVSVISNGVDLEYFSSLGILSSKDSQPTIVFTGAMDYFPNVDAVGYFCRDIFPLVLRTMPKAQFYIVGRNPTRQVKQLGRQTNVIVTGTVPDVRPYLAEATISIAPFRLARGVQNKVLESMAMGVPVVGTTEAFKGIAATEQDGVRIADDPHSFAQHVTTLLQGDAALRQEIGLHARRYVERHHRWEDQGAKLERLIEEVVQKHARKENAIHRRDTEIAEEFA